MLPDTVPVSSALPDSVDEKMEILTVQNKLQIL